MAYKRRSKRYRRRRKSIYKRKRSFRRKNAPFNRRSLKLRSMVMPPKAYVKLKYRQIYSPQLVLGNYVRTFRLNSINDPDESGILNAQPYFMDQWNGFYNKYQVNAVKIRYQVTDVTNSDQCWAYLVPYKMFNTPTPVQHPNDLDRPGYQFRTIMGFPQITNQGSKTVKAYYKMKNITGDSYTDINYQAVFTSNPATQVYLQAGLVNFSEQSTATYRVNMTIIYYCVLMDRQYPGQS